MKQRSIPLHLIILLYALASLSATVSAATYYVATNGKDSNPGTSSAPFRTIAQGVSVLQPGDTLLIREGTYKETLHHGSEFIPSGLSWSQPITISAYPGEKVTMKPYSGGSVLGLTGGQQYLIIKGIIFDAINCSGDAVGINSGTHHIRFIDGEIKNASKSGVLISPGGRHIPATDIEFINMKIYDNNSSGKGHGMYISTSNNLVDGCEVYRNGGYGIHVYAGKGRADNNTVRNNKVYDNGRNPDTGFTAAGIILSGGDGNEAYNNVVWNNPNGISVSWQNPVNAAVYNNTIYNNSGAGITINYALNTLVANNITYNNGVDLVDNGIGTNLANNLLSDPHFANPDSFDFTLRDSSPAIDAGIDLPNGTDILGRSRTGHTDIGAFEHDSENRPASPRGVRPIFGY